MVRPRTLACALALLVTLLLTLGLAGAPVVARADEASPGAAVATGSAASGGVSDADSLVASIDELVTQAEAGWDVLMVVVTQDGLPVVQRTYRADDEGAVSTEGSTGERFDWGRASDLLVWAAVMQLVDAGELSLESRVYLRLPDGVELPDGYESLTILDLMNHSSGLDASPRSLAAARGSSGQTVADALADYELTASFEPGEVVAYAPTDAALAAAVVEYVSGMSITDYLRERILEPLGAWSTEVVVGELEGSTDEGGSQMIAGHDGDLEDVTAGFLNNPVISCVGTASDLALVERGLMGLVPQDGGSSDSILSQRSVKTLFTVSRTFPSLGTPRVAHGLFVLPLDDAAFGMSGSTWTGFSSAAYMDVGTGTGVVVLVNQAWREDLTLGVARLVFGTGELDSVEQFAAEAAQAVDEAQVEDDGSLGVDLSVWTGVYQDANLPEHGPAKLLAGLSRMFVTTTAGEDGSTTLALWGVPLGEVGLGLYLDDADDDLDAYRFHVALVGGAGYARVESDAYAVSLSRLAIEGALVVGMGVALVVCGCYSLAAAVRGVRARLLRRPWGGQPSCAALAGLTLAAGVWTSVTLFFPDTSVAISLFPIARAANLGYVILAALLLAWLGVTRWRGTQRAPRRFAACLAVMVSALVAVLNLIYWEMLP